MLAEKEHFLKNSLVTLLSQLPSDTLPKWGKMNRQQMVEHLTYATRIASGILHITEQVMPAEQMEKARVMILNDKPMRQNIENPLLPKIPPPVFNESFATAAGELQNEIDYFFKIFAQHPGKLTWNPLFGNLNYEENVQVLYKHSIHHAGQFGVSVVPKMDS